MVAQRVYNLSIQQENARMRGRRRRCTKKQFDRTAESSTSTDNYTITRIIFWEEATAGVDRYKLKVRYVHELM